MEQDIGRCQSNKNAIDVEDTRIREKVEIWNFALLLEWRSWVDRAEMYIPPRWNDTHMYSATNKSFLLRTNVVRFSTVFFKMNILGDLCLKFFEDNIELLLISIIKIARFNFLVPDIDKWTQNKNQMRSNRVDLLDQFH